MDFLLVVVGFWAMIRMNLFPSKYRYLASAGDTCLIALLCAGLLCWIVASFLFALRLS